MNDKKVLDERWKSRYNEEESSRCLHKIKNTNKCSLFACFSL
ncbi:uncharacterized protein LMUH8_1462 [Listeria monocytogenes]|nr:hypothetical protein LMxysn_1408 [Listeria monocytogenes]EEW21599.1 predicted protein [Listeria monocytogenes F6900]EFF98374.1 predicted protein [Listeria monocytogenes J2818]EXL12424.1 hypothetical protein X844_2280 [Listeria monocytogenes Lm_1823]EXL15042.1 hypothetical protein X843_1328 [Listeria monocytogenes Lm_1840]EXL23071.1 hypothetical protein X847_1711 [Listeria monocytogenes Lm_1889]